MGASVHTDPVNLSQFSASDKPSWLGDYNADMLKINNEFAAKEAEIATLTNQLNIANSALATANARITALAAATGHVGI